MAEYEQLACAYQYIKDIVESGTYQMEPRNQKPCKKRSKKCNKKSCKDDNSSSESSSELSSNTSEDKCHKSKWWLASQHEAERAIAAYKKRGWQWPDAVVVSNNTLLQKECMDGQSQGQGQMTIRKDTPPRQIRNRNLLAVLLHNPDGENTTPEHPETDEKQKGHGKSNCRG